MIRTQEDLISIRDVRRILYIKEVKSVSWAKYIRKWRILMASENGRTSL